MGMIKIIGIIRMIKGDNKIIERLKNWEKLMKKIKSEKPIIIDNIFILIDKSLFFNEKWNINLYLYIPENIIQDILYLYYNINDHPGI
jgi:hypothetical protein